MATGEIHLARGLPILAGSPLLIGLLYALAWSLTNTDQAHVRAEAAAATDTLIGALNRRSGEAVVAQREPGEPWAKAPERVDAAMYAGKEARTQRVHETLTRPDR